MKRIVFDIETVGTDFVRLDDFSQQYFQKFFDAEEVQRVHDSLSFYPLTAQIVAIAMVDAQQGDGAVYFQDNGGGLSKFKRNGFYFYPVDEKTILKSFWKQLRRYDSFVTFNGRMFDGPFVMIRSMINRVKVERNLVPYRYSAAEHVDLADQLSFYGCLSRKFPLHMWCQAFGIQSPKGSGVSGLDVKDLFYQGQYERIARYCLDDVLATKKLYNIWKESFSS